MRKKTRNLIKYIFYIYILVNKYRHSRKRVS